MSILEVVQGQATPQFVVYGQKNALRYVYFVARTQNMFFFSRLCRHPLYPHLQHQPFNQNDVKRRGLIYVRQIH